MDADPEFFLIHWTYQPQEKFEAEAKFQILPQAILLKGTLSCFQELFKTTLKGKIV